MWFVQYYTLTNDGQRVILPRVRQPTQTGGFMKRLETPLLLFLIAASVSFVFSVVLWFFVDKDTGLFVGIWVPSILSLAAALRRP